MGWQGGGYGCGTERGECTAGGETKAACFAAVSAGL